MLSWTLGRVAGIELRVHATFLVLLLWALAGGPGESGLATGPGGLALAAGVALAALVHELAHAAAARAFGIRTREVTLTLLGGIARVERPVDSRLQEAVVALAGPLANLALAGACAAALGASSWPGSVDLARADAGALLTLGLWTNAVLAALNLLPAFPLDGGRLLRAGLTRSHDFVEATRLTVKAGRVVAVALALGGILVTPLLLLAALIVWTSGPSELRAVESRRKLGEVAPIRVKVIHGADDAG